MILITLLCMVLASSESVDGPDSDKSDLIYPNVLVDMDCRGSGWDNVNYGFNGTREGSEGKFLDMKCHIHVVTDDDHVCHRRWEHKGNTYYGCDTRIKKFKNSHWCSTEGSEKGIIATAKMNSTAWAVTMLKARDTETTECNAVTLTCQ